MLLRRAAPSALALIVCAWFAIGARQAHETNVAAAIVASGTRPQPAQAARAAGALRAASFLNPDTTVDVLRAELDMDEGEMAAARAVLERVVAREPRNAVAWQWLARASPPDSKAAFVATVHVDLLAPPIPAPHAR